MPVYEMRCQSCATVDDCYLHRWDDANPPCPHCGGERERLVSSFAMPFAGSIHKYTDLRREDSHIDGFWCYRKRSSISGQPEPVYISSMSELKAFNKAEGLASPGEIPTNCTISPDGKKLVSNGMPGQWAGGIPEMPARLREMIAVKAEDCYSPATASPRMPSDYGMKIEAVSAEDAAKMANAGA